MDRKPYTSASPNVALNCSNTLSCRSQDGRRALMQVTSRYRANSATLSTSVRPALSCSTATRDPSQVAGRTDSPTPPGAGTRSRPACAGRSQAGHSPARWPRCRAGSSPWTAPRSRPCIPQQVGGVCAHLYPCGAPETAPPTVTAVRLRLPSPGRGDRRTQWPADVATRSRAAVSAGHGIEGASP